jgi:hypothetical protein
MDKLTKILHELVPELGEISINVGDKTLKLKVLDIVDNTATPTATSIDKNTTIVTGLWDLGRGEISDEFRRSYDHYKQKFAELLKNPSNMYIYVSRKDEEFVWQHRSRHNTVVKTMELDEFGIWFEFFDKVQDIRQKPEWYQQAGWLEESPQAKLKYYNPIVLSKMFLLNNAAIINPFGSEYFYWIDAGITNTVHPGYFYHDMVFNNLPEYTKQTTGFVFISYPYEDGAEIHGFPRTALEQYCNTKHVKYVCRGGFFGGTKEKIHELNGYYYYYLSSTISAGYMGTEESIFTILAHQYESFLTRFTIEGNGLIWPFFEKLKNVNALIKELPPKPPTPYTVKNTIYVLGFNSPKQFELLCKSLINADPKMIDHSRKILINNSTDPTVFESYDKICQMYGFEEIRKDNLGVCGGRQFVAEHFDESDADFYMFFEDDMFLNDSSKLNETCKNGFKKYISDVYEKIARIMIDEKFDFLKLSFTEFYGDNGTQWAWYNVPQNIREQYWPEYHKLPEHGTDPNAPKTEFKNIKSLMDVSYATGDIYYSNWPQIVSREGNKKMFLDTKWAHPYEQTWMSHMFQLGKAGQLRAGLLLATLIHHNRFDFYESGLRKES